MKNNLHDIQNNNYDILTTHNINDKKPKYGNVVITELPKDSVIIINGDNIKIIKKDKILKVDENMDIEVIGDITIKAKNINIIPEGTSIENMEGLVSYNKLKQALQSSLGNFGSLIQFPTTLEENIITYPNIKIGIS